jgi:hypothetical protein
VVEDVLVERAEERVAHDAERVLGHAAGEDAADSETSRRVEESKSRRVSRRVKESKSRRVEESKSESKSRRVSRRVEE